MRPWVRITNAVLSICGLGVSIYLTIAHFNTSVTLACPATSTINCEKVTTSPESYFLHIPVAVLGLAFYLVMVTLSSPKAWANPNLERVRLLLSGVGVVFILWLVYSEIVTIGAICLWCTSVHIITLANFLILLLDYLSPVAKQSSTIKAPSA